MDKTLKKWIDLNIENTFKARDQGRSYLQVIKDIASFDLFLIHI